MHSIINYHNMIGAIRAYCAKNKLTLQLIEGGPTTAATDGKTVYLPAPNPDWTEKDFKLWLFLAFHEAGHNKAPCDDLFFLLDREKLYGSEMMWYLNIVDDFRQERVDTGVFHGRDTAVNEGRAAVTMDTISALKEKGMPSADLKQRISSSMFVWTDRNRPSFQPAMAGLGDIVYDMLTPEQQAWCDQLEAYDSRLCTVYTAEEEHELVRDILRDVFKVPPEDIKKMEDGMSKEEAKKAQKAGKKHKAKGEQQPGEGEPGQEQAEGEEEQGNCARWEDLIPDNHDKFTASYEDSHIDYSGYSYNEYEFRIHPDPEIIVPSGRKRHTLNTVGSMANRVRKLLRVKSQKRWTHQLEKGKLSSRSLHHIVDDTENYRLYKQKSSSISLDCAVTLLIDMSGSMGGQKWKHAIDAAYNMYSALAKLRIPTEIIGFQSSHRDTFYLYKTFGEKASDNTVRDRLECSTPGSSNEDAAALMFAASRLLCRKEVGKHLIVFSDGSPAGYLVDSMSAAKKIIRKIEASPIKLIGVGIMDTNVRKMYKDNAVIKDVNELENALMKIIQQRLM